MKSKGSVQVIEISFVLPVAMLVVISLVYLAFAMFLHGHCKNLASIAATNLCTKAGKNGLYWQVLGNYIDNESLGEISSELSSDLDACKILPGLKFDPSCTVTGKLRTPVANVYIAVSYFGKQLFKVEVTKTAYKPKEFAELVDFGKSIENDFEVLKDIYDSFF
ncbi:MAG: hypothetical protein MJ143_04070 [Clostridia bacterium]|nr:hypothetical protein [Clostridia bacterium]